MRTMRINTAIAVLNDHEFVVLLNGTDLMKYNTIQHEWTHFLQIYERHTLARCATMALDKEANRLYILYQDYLKIVDVSTQSIIEQHVAKCVDECFRNVVIVHANGTLHRMGGELYHYHAIWDETQRDWIPNVCPFPSNGDEDELANIEVIYVKSSKVILVLGGNFYTDGGHDGELEVIRYRIETMKWEDAGVEYGGRGALTSDERYLIMLFGRYIRIVDLYDEHNYKCIQTVELPRGLMESYPVVMKNQETNVISLTSGWFRKLFRSQNAQQHNVKVVCPLDVLKLIDQFVCQEMVHLISGKSHVAYHLTDILSSKSVDLERETKPRQLPALKVLDTNRDKAKPHGKAPVSGTSKQFTICSFLCFVMIAYLMRVYNDDSY